ncbi:MAG: LicD family protein [Elusimicrobia bacterium]|nr:LicD family protein [Elusimicrobiota bacterium]
MQITPEIVKKLQQIELNMLKIFLEICEKENLHYYLLGGTLLGAVRHKGFIPWDDDIDIGMPRKDYEIFLSVAKKYLPTYYFLQTCYTDKGYPLPFAKLRDSRTVYKEKPLRNLHMNHGVWIDIFPLDFCPKHYFWFNIYFRLLRKRVFCQVEGIRTLKHKALKYLSYLICPSWHKAVKRQDLLMKSVKKYAPSTINWGGAYGKKEIVPTEWYAEGTVLTFEGLQVKGPKHYDKWLRHIYGNYMKLPPLEKRVAAHEPAEIKL